MKTKILWLGQDLLSKKTADISQLASKTLDSKDYYASIILMAYERKPYRHPLSPSDKSYLVTTDLELDTPIAEFNERLDNKDIELKKKIFEKNGQIEKTLIEPEKLLEIIKEQAKIYSQGEVDVEIYLDSINQLQPFADFFNRHIQLMPSHVNLKLFKDHEVIELKGQGEKIDLPLFKSDCLKLIDKIEAAASDERNPSLAKGLVNLAANLFRLLNGDNEINQDTITESFSATINEFKNTHELEHGVATNTYTTQFLSLLNESKEDIAEPELPEDSEIGEDKLLADIKNFMIENKAAFVSLGIFKELDSHIKKYEETQNRYFLDTLILRTLESAAKPTSPKSQNLSKTRAPENYSRKLFISQTEATAANSSSDDNRYLALDLLYKYRNILNAATDSRAARSGVGSKASNSQISSFSETNITASELNPAAVNNNDEILTQNSIAQALEETPTPFKPIIDAIKTYADTLAAIPNDSLAKEKSDILFTLHSKLNETIIEHMKNSSNSTPNFEALKAKLADITKKTLQEKSILKEHRSWLNKACQLICNFLLGVTTLGIGIGIKRLATGSCLFRPATKSEQLLHRLETGPKTSLRS